MSVQILIGDARTRLAELPAESVHCVVTSPPYFGLRDYKMAAQIGLESTPDAYVANLVEVFRAVRRVLRKDGTLWLNLGDSYASNGTRANNNGEGASTMGWPGQRQETLNKAAKMRLPPVNHGVKPKDLIGIPWQVAFALRADGWYLRSDIIWAKPNPMPESVTDRPTSAHEHVFLLSKSARYWYDADAVRENSISDQSDGRRGNGGAYAFKPTMPATHFGASSYRNLRNVWTIATAPYPEAHFATFPPKLVEPCIKAGTSERGCCAECGAPWARQVESSPMEVRDGPKSAANREQNRTATSGTMTKPPESRTIGWAPSCACEAATVSATVLDPFGGAGTTGLVADRLQRAAVLIELNPEYAALAERRIHGDAPMFANVAADRP